MPSNKKITLRVHNVVKDKVIEIASRQATEHFAVVRTPNDAGQPTDWGWDARHIRTGVPLPHRFQSPQDAHRLARAAEGTSLSWDIDDPDVLQFGWTDEQRGILSETLCTALQDINSLEVMSLQMCLEFVNWEETPPSADPGNAPLTVTFFPRRPPTRPPAA